MKTTLSNCEKHLLAVGGAATLFCEWATATATLH